MERTSNGNSFIVNMRKFLLIVLLVLGLNLSAQVKLEFGDLLETTVNKPTDKSKQGKFKAQKIKGKISGMGILLFNNGSLYYGDFHDKVFHGKGTLISVDSISGCPKGSIYVGRFKNGVKNGRGRCYNANGELIYDGLFKNDEPVYTYPSVFNMGMDLPYFTEFVTDEYTFLGEFNGDNPNGQGMFIFKDGDLYLTELIEGAPNGISVFIQPDDNWISEKIENGESTPISSSSHYESLNKQAKENFRAGLSIALGYFSQALESGAQLTSQIESMSRGTTVQMNESNVTYESNDSGNPTGRVNKNSSTNKYNISEQQNYNRDKSTYHKYDGLLAKAFAGNSSATTSEIKEWQNKMKQLREKWEKKGRDFPHFPNEDR